MNREKDKQAINAAKLYYRSDYSQQRIAEELGISLSLIHISEPTRPY